MSNVFMASMCIEKIRMALLLQEEEKLVRDVMRFMIFCQASVAESGVARPEVSCK